MFRRFLPTMVGMLVPWMVWGADKKSEPKLDLTQPYLLISTQRYSTFEKEFGQAIDAGYRVVLAGAGHPVVLLRRATSAPADEEYLLVKNKKGIPDAVSKGYRVQPGRIFDWRSYIMSRPKGAPPGAPCEYAETFTHQREANRHSDAGFEFVDIANGWFLFQRPLKSGSSPGPLVDFKSATENPGRYRLLAAKKTSTLQKELDEAVEAGYRPRAASSSKVMGRGQGVGLFNIPEIEVLLEKTDAPGNPHEVLLLTTNKATTLEKELNEAAARGFRAIGRTLAYTGEWAVLMEKDPVSPVRCEYRLIGGDGVGALAGDGFSVIGLVHLEVALLEKRL